MDRHDAERGFVAGKRKPVAAVKKLRVSIRPGAADHAPPARERFPVVQRTGGLDQARDDFRGPERIAGERFEQTPRGPPSGLTRHDAPARVQVQELHAVEGRGPLSPLELPLRRIGVGDDAEPAETLDVLDDIACFSAKGIGRRRHVERDVMPAGGADLDAVEAEDAGSVRRRVGCARGVPVVCEHHELPPDASGRRGNFVRTAQPV